MEDKLSKGKINKIGDSIRNALLNNQKISDEDLLILQKYRTSFKDPLKKANDELNRIMKNIDKTGVITYRVKRIESIFSKLLRFQDMQLARMHDIAGARCILASESKVRAFVEEVRQSKLFEVKDIDDYITNPKDTGYKSIHLRCICDGQYIEIQVRDEIQHSWATLVEITDVIYGTRIKENKDDKQTGLYAFLQLFSKSKDLTTSERNKINEVLEKTKFIQKLTDTFCKNAIALRDNWCKNARKVGQFYVFEVDKKNNPKINVFDDFGRAEEQYFSTFTTNIKKEKNLVMAYVFNDDFELISKAYSNYVLVKHDFYLNLSNILRNDSRDNNVNARSYNLLRQCLSCYLYVHVSEAYNVMKNPNYNRKYDEWLENISNEMAHSSLPQKIGYKVDPKWKGLKKIDLYFLKAVVKFKIISIRVKILTRRLEKDRKDSIKS